MKPASASFTACAVLAVACLAWIAAISLVLVHFLDLPATTGWIVAATLGLSLSMAVAVILYEMRHAMDLTDYVDPGEFNGLQPSGLWSVPSNPVFHVQNGAW